MRAIVFGATLSAKEMYRKIMEQYEIVAFADNDPNKQGGGIFGAPVISPLDIRSWTWDEIIIVSFSSKEAIKKQLVDMGIPEQKINTQYIDSLIEPRKKFCEDFASIIYHNNILGNVAEAGVFQGEYASVINKSFPDRKLYLFDTFEGFDLRDVIIEEKNDFSDAKVGQLGITSENMVLDQMIYRENCIIKKGYFPESAKNVLDKFCYVNLDMDLYKPTLEGLRFFYPFMVKGGIITIHDYFSQGYEGVKVAVKEFIKEREEEIIPFPIGDHVSIAIQKG